MNAIQATQGAEGFRIRFYTNSDLTGIQAAHVKVTKPDGTQTTWTLDVSNTASDDPNYSHMLVYTTSAQDLEQAGNYALEVWVDLGSFKGYAAEPVWLDVREVGKL